MGKGREEGRSHTNEPGRSCKACCGRGSIERHEFLEPGACQVGLAARVKHDAADGHGGAPRAHPRAWLLQIVRFGARGSELSTQRLQASAKRGVEFADARRGWPGARAF
jgi:hypothetical protein